jgi:hypothetical protein
MTFTLVVVSQGKADRYMLITSNRSISVDNKYGSSAVVSCECELIVLHAM